MCHLLLRPGVQSRGAHKAEVRAQVAVERGALEANEDAVGDGSPSGVLGRAIHTCLVRCLAQQPGKLLQPTVRGNSKQNGTNKTRGTLALANKDNNAGQRVNTPKQRPMVVTFRIDVRGNIEHS
jgi:hypothetical protein